MRPYVLGVLACIVLASAAMAQPTAFTYQGRLTNGAQPAAGLHDFRFRLWDAASGGTQIGTTQCANNVAVAGGVFATTIDFGLQYATPSPRFLEILVRADIGQPCTDDFGYIALTPRQPLTAAPLASHAQSASALAAADGSPAQAVAVDSSGNVGIGTTVPTTRLDVRGGPILVENLGDQADLLWLASERSWVFRQEGTGATTALKLQSAGGGGNKNFVVQTDGYMLLPGLGGLGIGTAAPQGRLDVNGKVRVKVANIAENFEVRDIANNTIFIMGKNPVNVTEPLFSLVSPVSGDTQAGVFRNSLSGNGVVFGDVKNFRAPNPADLTTDIWYCCPEGPEAAMYVRGTGRISGGRARIELPEHFRLLASEPGMTVQLTPLSGQSKGLAVARKSLGGIEVVELGDGAGEYEFDWRVEAVRKGYEDYQVIRPWMQSDPDSQKAWQNRLRWIEERKAKGMP